MQDDEHTVAGALHVVLHPVDAERFGGVDGREGVLRRVTGRSPVGHHDRVRPVGGDLARRLGPVCGQQQGAGAEQGGGRGGGCGADGHGGSSRRESADTQRVTVSRQHSAGQR